MIDVISPAAPGSLMRAARITAPGVFRISKRDCELYSVQITGSGAWGRFKIVQGDGRALFEMPSTFTGSFVVGAGALGGLIVVIDAMTNYESAQLCVNFRERDRGDQT